MNLHCNEDEKKLKKIANDNVFAQYIIGKINEESESYKNIDINGYNAYNIFNLCKDNQVYLKRFWDIYKNKSLKESDSSSQEQKNKTKSEFYKFIDILKKTDSCLDNLDIIIKYYDARFHQEYVTLDQLLIRLPTEQKIQLLLNNHNKHQENEDLIGQDQDKFFKLLNLLTENTKREKVKNIDKYYKDFIDKYPKNQILDICTDYKKIVFNFLLNDKIEPETEYNAVFNFFKDRNMPDSILKLHVYKNTQDTVEYINNMTEFNKDNIQWILSEFKTQDYNGIKNKESKKIDQIGYISKTREELYPDNFNLFFKSFINNVDITNYYSPSRHTNSEKYNFVFDMLLGKENEYNSSCFGCHYNAIKDLLNLSKLNLKVSNLDDVAVNFLNDNPEFKEQCYKNILKNIGYYAEQIEYNQLFGLCLQEIPNENHDLLASLVKTYYELSDFDKENNHFDINYKYFPILMKAGNVVFREKDIMGAINAYSNYLENRGLIFKKRDNIYFLKGERGEIENNRENQDKFLDKLWSNVIALNESVIKTVENRQKFKDLDQNHIAYNNKSVNLRDNEETLNTFTDQLDYQRKQVRNEGDTVLGGK
jgi:hypothetical protein